MKVHNIHSIVAMKKWVILIKEFLPVTIAVSFSFEESMHIVHDLLLFSSETDDRSMTDLVRDYCVNVMIILREKYPHEWKLDWKNEAFLGILCGLVYREEEAFKFIKNAYEQADDPPQSLILAYISAGETSSHFLSKKAVIELSEKAVKKGISYEVALLMRSIAHFQGDFEQSEGWKKKADQAQKRGLHTRIITPNVLKDVFKSKEGYQYEE